MTPPQTTAETRPSDGDELVDMRFQVPRAWKEELVAAARVQRISTADLMRIVTRGFLRERYDEAKQRQLGLV